MRGVTSSADALWATMQEDARAVRETERGLARSSELEPYLAHAANVERLTEALRDVRMPIKATFSAARLNYQLARQAVTLAETVERFEGRLPEIRTLGPSFVLLLNEAERRFEREGRADELPDFLDDLARGLSRSKLREKYLPPRRSPPAAVFAALKAGRVDHAKRAFDDCEPADQGRLRRIAFMLAQITGAVEIAPPELAGSTIDEAVMAAVDADLAAEDGLVPRCDPNDRVEGG